MPTMSPLVEKLSVGEHPVSLSRYKTAQELQEAVRRGLLLVKFTGTQGGTEVGISLEKDTPEPDTAAGEISLTGSLTLDYQPVRCSIRFDPKTMTGQGSLVPVDEA